MQTVRQAGRQNDYANSLERKKKWSRTNKQKSSLSHKPLSLTRLLSTTTQVKQQKSNNYISNVHAKSKCNRSFLHQFVFKTNITQTIIYETFLRYSKQNKQPTKKEAEKRFKANTSKTSTTTLLTRTKQDEKITNSHTLGKDEKTTNFLCAPFRNQRKKK